jgi:hypothetical protein
LPPITIRDVGRGEREERAVEQAAMAALDADDVDALRPRDQGRRADRRVHPRSVPAAGQDADALDCHVRTLLRHEGCLNDVIRVARRRFPSKFCRAATISVRLRDRDSYRA